MGVFVGENEGGLTGGIYLEGRSRSPTMTRWMEYEKAASNSTNYDRCAPRSIWILYLYLRFPRRINSRVVKKSPLQCASIIDNLRDLR